MKTQFEYTGGLEAFQNAYLECALWSSLDESDPETGGEPLDATHSTDDVAPETVCVMQSECADFVGSNAALLADWDAVQSGHDFWLTRNRHGAGFWDRGKGANGDALTESAQLAGERDLYVGDDGMVHQS